MGITRLRKPSTPKPDKAHNGLPRNRATGDSYRIQLTEDHVFCKYGIRHEGKAGDEFTVFPMEGERLYVCIHEHLAMILPASSIQPYSREV